MRRSPGDLADALADLPVRVSSIRVVKSAVGLRDYPGGLRPSSVVCLSGDDYSGFGENIAFTDAEHDDFATNAAHHLSLTAGVSFDRRVGDCLRREGTPPTQRAALEAALIDLSLRQAGLSLGWLTGADQAAPHDARIRVVVSFAACADPCAEVRRLRAAGARDDLKVDVDPRWDAATRQALAREAGGIAILDFKGRGDEALVQTWAALLPDAIFEDPPARGGHRRVARDAPLVDARAVGAAAGLGEAVNLKAPRMGGPLELLRGLQAAIAARSFGGAAAAGLPVAYVGGMFEVGVGRTQARQLAALYCPDAPNDLAAIVRDAAGDSTTAKHDAHHTAVPVAAPVAAPMRIRLDTPGFGVP